VDDGSTDDSPQILQSYGDRIVALLRPHGGQAAAFKAGFAQSHGAVVIFLDSDDMLLPRTAERVAAAFAAQPDLAKVAYRLEVMDAAGRPTGQIKPPAGVALSQGDLRRQALRFPYDLTWMATSGNAFAARVLRQMFPIPERLYGDVGADWYLAHVSLLYGPVDVLPDVGGYYRVHGANGYEIADAAISLKQVRQSIGFMARTNRCLKRAADRLDLRPRPRRAGDILSVAFIAHRLISLKFDARQHPIPGDRPWRLGGLGVRAALGRFDVPLARRGLYALWFVLMAPAPPPLARTLAELLLVPETRRLRGGILHRQKG
jgi:glycosyltransferase involved in cell wall biosynthesis